MVVFGSSPVAAKKISIITYSSRSKTEKLTDTAMKIFVTGILVALLIATTIMNTVNAVWIPNEKGRTLIVKIIRAKTVPAPIMCFQRRGTLNKARLNARYPEHSGMPCIRNNSNFTIYAHQLL
jgi:hypothetical protein